MRKPLLLAVFIIFQLASTAQAYHPLIEDDKVWLEASYIGTNECAFDEVYELRFGGDTLIEGTTYRKILKRSFDPVDPGPYCPPFEAQDFETMVPDVFMREDTTARQVFIWHVDENDYPDGQELLLYDFTLEVGDTLPESDYLTLGGPCMVTLVSLTALLTGETPQRIHYTGADIGSYVEGLGGEYGLYQPLFPGIGFWSSTLCVKRGGEFIYSTDISMTQCTWMTTGLDEDLVEDIQLFPNPNSGSFSFDLNAQAVSGAFQLVIFNTMGQRVFTDRVVNGMNAVKVDLPAGLYQWQLRVDQRPSQSGKLIIQ